MTSMLSRAVAAVRVWLGFNDPSENHLHQAHGWLLPSVALAPARATTPSPVDSLKRGQQK